jgi:hypothetical protein
MSEKEFPSVDDFVVTIEMSIKEVNALLNILNTPNQVPTTTFVAFINMIQMQAGPQVQQAEAGLAAVKNADGVPKNLEERN